MRGGGGGGWGGGGGGGGGGEGGGGGGGVIVMVAARVCVWRVGGVGSVKGEGWWCAHRYAGGVFVFGGWGGVG